MDLPEPLTPADADLQGYGFMPLYGHRLFGSDFNAKCNDTEWRAGVTLWWAAWNQIPAGSLPDDESALCRLADLGRDLKTWRRIRAQALYGFIKCSDGRLYHKTLAPLVKEAWERRQSERERKRKYRGRAQGRDADVPDPETGTEDGTSTGTAASRPPVKERIGEDSERIGQKEESPSSAASSVPPPRAPATLPPDRAALKREDFQSSEGKPEPSHEEKIKRLDEIFEGAGANITNLSRFSAWVTWGYDWHLDVEPTLLAIAQRNGAGFLPGTLTYFDKPIGETHRARLAGLTSPAAPATRRLGRLTSEEIRATELSVAEKRAYLENWGMTRAGPAEIDARVKAEGLADRWHRGAP